MEKRKDNEGEIEKQEANNSLVLFFALRKDIADFEDVMTAKGQEVENMLRSILYDVDNNVACKYDMHHVLASLRLLREHPYQEVKQKQPSSLMWLFRKVRTLLSDQGNKEKIERVLNSIELVLLDRISQAEIEHQR
ncbi:hypothetical protein H5410_029589 [Solanum commersonii]|uniref:Uncharacterized protein n=1 Tax=Solanum commersonii TaxID=4109 RepID=A0A9J5YBX6_SOLCO|nr:hypothetical protein H5410_029589 [Solanum commersonii]